MKKLFMAGAALLLALMSSAETTQTLPDWQDARIIQRNRYPMTATFETDGQKLSLNGVWKFQWYPTIPERSKTFFAADFDDSAWDTMPVPYRLGDFECACMGKWKGSRIQRGQQA